MPALAHRRREPPSGTAGSGLPTVVMVHGLGMSSRSLVRLQDRVGERTRTLAPDLPGYGHSRRPHAGRHQQVPELAGIVAGWLRDRATGPAVLVGHSLGAQVVAELAAAHPDLARALVLVAPSGDVEVASVARQAARLAVDLPRESPGLARVAAGDYLRAGPGQMLQLARRALRRSREQLRTRLALPVTVVRGSRDPVATERWCRSLVDRAEDGRYVEVPGEAHGVVYDAPPLLVEAVLAAASARPPR